MATSSGVSIPQLDWYITSGDVGTIKEMMSELKNSKQLRHENKSLINCAYIRQADLAEKVQAALSLKVVHTVSLEQRLVQDSILILISA